MNAPIRINLGYRDARAAIHFLVEAFGFREAVAYDNSDDSIGYAELEWPAGGLVTIHSAEPGKSAVAELAAGARRDGGYPAYSIHIDVDAPDALFTRAVAAGASVIRKVTDSPQHGTRGFVVADPEGLYWSFGTPLPRLERGPDGRWQPAASATG